MPTRLARMPARRFAVLLALTGAVLIAGCAGSSTATSSPSASSAAASSTGASSAGTSAGAGSAGTSAGAGSAGTSAGATTSSTTASAAPQIGFEGIPLEQGPPLGAASTTGKAPVDGIRCAPGEQLVYHIHARFAVFVNGRLYQLPAGIGIPGSVAELTTEGPIAAGGRCYYWLHTHTTDGVIHIESPSVRIYTLGNFFDEWHQPLRPDQVAAVHGKIIAFVDGKLWKRSLRAIPLLPHADIQFDVGEPAPPLLSVSWSGTHL